MSRYDAFTRRELQMIVSALEVVRPEPGPDTMLALALEVEARDSLDEKEQNEGSAAQAGL